LFYMLSGVYRTFHKTNSFLRFYLCIPTPYFYGHALFSYCMLDMFFKSFLHDTLCQIT